MRQNYNFINNIQINLTIPRKENPELNDDLIFKMLEKLNHELLSQLNQKEVTKESHQYVINILGQFHPYHYDEAKHSDSLIEYDDEDSWVYGETKKIIDNIFKNIELTYFVGQMNFKGFDKTKD